MKRLIVSYCLIFLSCSLFSNPTNYIPDVYFTSGSSEIDSNGLESINQFVDFLNKNPVVQKIELEGHQDSLELGFTDTTLSWQRTQSVLKEIKKRYTGRCVFTSKSYGSSQPLGFYTTELYSVNRCVKYKITKILPKFTSVNLTIDSINQINTSPLLETIDDTLERSHNKYLIMVSIPYYAHRDQFPTINAELDSLYDYRSKEIINVLESRLKSFEIKFEEEHYYSSETISISFYILE